MTFVAIESFGVAASTVAGGNELPERPVDLSGNGINDPNSARWGNTLELINGSPSILVYLAFDRTVTASDYDLAAIAGGVSRISIPSSAKRYTIISASGTPPVIVNIGHC